MEMLFLPHFDIICDLLLKRCMATWNLSVKLIYAPQDRGGGYGREANSNLQPLLQISKDSHNWGMDPYFNTMFKELFKWNTRAQLAILES